MVKLSHLKLLGGLEDDAAVDEDAGVVDVVARAVWPDWSIERATCVIKIKYVLHPGIQLNYKNCSMTLRWHLK